VPNDTADLTVFFVHSGSAFVKAVRRTLMKLTAGRRYYFCFNFKVEWGDKSFLTGQHANVKKVKVYHQNSDSPVFMRHRGFIQPQTLGQLMIKLIWSTFSDGEELDETERTQKLPKMSCFGVLIIVCLLVMLDS